MREVEQRIAGLSGASCTQPVVDTAGVDASTLYAPERFPQILRAQIDLLVQAMACGRTRIGVVQAAVADAGRLGQRRGLVHGTSLSPKKKRGQRKYLLETNIYSDPFFSPQ